MNSNKHLIRQLNKLVEQTIKSNNDEIRLEKRENKRFFANASITIILAILAGFQTYYISKQEQQIKNFDTLLKYSRQTDSSINQELSQLNVLLDYSRKNEIEKYKNNNVVEVGNMFRLKDKLHEIHLLFRSKSFERPYKYDVESLKKYQSTLKEMKTMFYEEMNNPYLNSYDTLQMLWIIAYGEIGERYRQIGIRLRHPNIDSTGLASYFNGTEDGLWTSIVVVTSHGFNRIKKDRIRKGILTKDGKYKINPNDFFR
jgi:hypothetical protein